MKQDRFQVCYSICGCEPIEWADRHFEEGLSSKLERSNPFRKARPFRNDRPDLISRQESDAIATHPSEHNSVVLLVDPKFKAWRSSREARDKRETASLKWLARKSVWKDMWYELSFERKRRQDHDRAFFAPYWGM